MPGGSHPVSRDIEKLVAQLKVCGQLGQAHAVARVLDALVIGSHQQRSLGADKRALSHRRLDQSRYWMVHLIRELYASMFASRLMRDILCPTVRSGDEGRQERHRCGGRQRFLAPESAIGPTAEITSANLSLTPSIAALIERPDLSGTGSAFAQKGTGGDMRDDLSAYEVQECYRRAAEARSWADAAVGLAERADLMDVERGWLSVVRASLTTRRDRGTKGT